MTMYACQVKACATELEDLAYGRDFQRQAGSMAAQAFAAGSNFHELLSPETCVELSS